MEEEFDWNAALPPREVRFTHAGDLERALGRLSDAGVRPTLLVTHRAAEDDEARDLLAHAARRGRIEPGAHLHPWVTPPFRDGEGDERATFPGNLPRLVEGEKLRVLTERLAGVFGKSPRVYQAGRYGIGPNTPSLLAAEGYEISLSASPGFDYSTLGGPDFSRTPPHPFLHDADAGLVELPVSGGLFGFAGSLRPALHRIAHSPPWRTLRLGGLLARVRAVERLRLSPEGHRLDDLLRLARSLLDVGAGVLVLGVHSPSFAPGGSPYVPDRSARDRLLERTLRFVERFRGDFGGRPATAAEVRALLLRRPDGEGSGP